MLTLYFSGTGNTKYIADRFSKTMKWDCYSIEEKADFESMITTANMIAFCYPVYGSCVPLIMREFVEKHKALLNRKKLIILCTQLIFSGDGARVFTELLNGISVDIVYAEHFNMPNNICNLFLLPVKSKEQTKGYLTKANKRLNKICANIENSIVKKRGFNVFSKYLGLFCQRFYFLGIEKKAKSNVKIDNDCNVCGKCIRLCPMKNLELLSNKIRQRGNCTLCYRCVNICPQKAITVLLHSRVKKQYHGVDGNV